MLRLGGHLLATKTVPHAVRFIDLTLELGPPEAMASITETPQFVHIVDEHSATAFSEGHQSGKDREPTNLLQKTSAISTVSQIEDDSSATSDTSSETHSYKVPPSGVWTPAITFFDQETEEINEESQAKYYSYLSKTGLAGLVVLGTNAETFLLTRDERKRLVEIAREACGPNFPIMAGVSGHSTKQVLNYIGDAAEAGADYVLLLPPAYFGKQTTPAVIDNFYNEVATKSPLPIVIYNLPMVCNGIDLDSATMVRLAKAHDNIVGVKLTCGAVAKIIRLSAELGSERFATFGGQSDFLLGAMASGAAGTICGFGNVFPRTIVKIYDLWKGGKLQEAMELHQKAAIAEQACKAGIATVKYAAGITTAKAAGIASASEQLKPRRPYLEPSEEEKRSIEAYIEDLARIEASL